MSAQRTCPAGVPLDECQCDPLFHEAGTTWLASMVDHERWIDEAMDRGLTLDEAQHESVQRGLDQERERRTA